MPIPEMRLPFFYHHKEKATIGMKQVYDDIIDYLKNARSYQQ